MYKGRREGAAGPPLSGLAQSARGLSIPLGPASVRTRPSTPSSCFLYPSFSASLLVAMVHKSLQLAISIAIPLVGGTLGGLLTGPEIKGWYSKLKKPRWTPPNILFPIMWPILYVFNGIASYNVLQSKGSGKTQALMLYGIQLVLNFAWTPLFFKVHRPDWALIDISAMLGMATTATVSMTKATSAKQILPFMGWLAYATALTASVNHLNPDASKIKSDVDADKSIPMSPMPEAEKKK
eukprot:gene17069-23362_t